MEIFLTGNPGSGKSTILMKVIDILKKNGLKIGGFITPEIRTGEKRIGFKVVNIHSGEEGILASIYQKHGPQVGKYRVNLEDFERVSLKALDFAMKECDIICVDEIGKMELFSTRFKDKIEEMLKIKKPFVCVIHRNLVYAYKKYGNLIYVTPENREKLPNSIVKLVYGSTQN